MAILLSDTSTWLPLEGFAPGLCEDQPAPSGNLTGQETTIAPASGPRDACGFEADSVMWRRSDGDGVALSGPDPVEVISIKGVVHLDQWQPASTPDEAGLWSWTSTATRVRDRKRQGNLL